MKVKPYCDANLGTRKDTLRSLNGYCVFLGNSLISWKTKKQNVISKSLVEVEYRIMAQTGCEIKWISQLLY